MLKINEEVLKKEYRKYEDFAEEYIDCDHTTEEGERNWNIYMALFYVNAYCPLIGIPDDEGIFERFKRNAERAIEDLKKLGYDITKIEG